MLRNEGYWFMRLGSVIERGDNTARLLDVKYYLLLPRGPGGGRRARPRPMDDDPPDRLGRTAYRHIYRERAEALAGRRLADLPPRDAALARRLGRARRSTCSPISATARGRQGEADRLARQRARALEDLDIDTIFQQRAARMAAAAIIARQCGARPGDRRAVQVRLMQLTRPLRLPRYHYSRADPAA